MHTISSNAVTIPRKITNGKELIVLTRDEYNKRLQRNKELLSALQVIADGERAYRQGKTFVASSTKEALKMYAKRKIR
jgi:chaperonin cofactor prefoldin